MMRPKTVGNFKGCNMNRDTVKITVKDVELEVEFTWSPIIRATREQPEEGGIEEIESVYCGDVDIIELLNKEAMDDVFYSLNDYMMDLSFRTEED